MRSPLEGVRRHTSLTAPSGDSIEAVCRKASATFDKPVIPVGAPDFAGL